MIDIIDFSQQPNFWSEEENQNQNVDIKAEDKVWPSINIDRTIGVTLVCLSSYANHSRCGWSLRQNVKTTKTKNEKTMKYLNLPTSW